MRKLLAWLRGRPLFVIPGASLAGEPYYLVFWRRGLAVTGLLGLAIAYLKADGPVVVNGGMLDLMLDVIGWGVIIYLVARVGMSYERDDDFRRRDAQKERKSRRSRTDDPAPQGIGR